MPSAPASVNYHHSRAKERAAREAYQAGYQAGFNDCLKSEAGEVDSFVAPPPDWEALKAENARLRAALTFIHEMADEDIREGTEGTFTAQIEADARAALNYTAGEES